MSETKKLPRKHIGKKVTDEIDKKIKEIQHVLGPMSYLEAKHEYFENRKIYDARDKPAAPGLKSVVEIEQETMQEIQEKYGGRMEQTPEHLGIAINSVREAIKETSPDAQKGAKEPSKEKPSKDKAKAKKAPQKLSMAQEIAAAAESDLQQIEKQARKKKATMTIEQTKLGITMVLSKDECAKIGLKGTMTTREAIKALKERLGVA